MVAALPHPGMKGEVRSSWQLSIENESLSSAILTLGAVTCVSSTRLEDLSFL